VEPRHIGSHRFQIEEEAVRLWLRTRQTIQTSRALFKDGWLGQEMRLNFKEFTKAQYHKRKGH
jgi:hypothetical protein